jgi:hypothetical protein
MEFNGVLHLLTPQMINVWTRSSDKHAAAIGSRVSVLVANPVTADDVGTEEVATDDRLLRTCP